MFGEATLNSEVLGLLELLFCVWASACVRACVHASVHASVRALKRVDEVEAGEVWSCFWCQRVDLRTNSYGLASRKDP